MALLAFEGFDDGLAALRWPTNAGLTSVTYGKNGKGMEVGDLAGDQCVIQVTAYSSDDTFTMGGWVYVQDDDAGANNMFAFVSENGTFNYYAVAVRRDSGSNRWEIQDRTGVTYAATGSCQFQTWYYAELQMTRHDTTGSWDLHIDGVSVASATSRDTIYGSWPPGYAIWGGVSTGDIDRMYIDDIYLLDSTGTSNNDFLGICKVETDLPSGNGNSSVLVGSDADSTDNYLLVDNNAAIPPATTEYVGSGTQGEKDTYAMTDLTTTGTVYAVQTTMYAQKDDTGAKFVRPVIRSGSTDYTGTSVALAEGTHIPVDEIWEVDPNTSSAWTYTNVNAIEVGPEVRDS